MNCKPGELAFIKRASLPENVGKVVRCLRIVTRWPGLITQDGVLIRGVIWETDTMLPNWSGASYPYKLDQDLCPIRPGDISDEEVRDLYAPKIPEAA